MLDCMPYGLTGILYGYLLRHTVYILHAYYALHSHTQLHVCAPEPFQATILKCFIFKSEFHKGFIAL